jgi:hypothetical protein
MSLLSCVSCAPKAETYFDSDDGFAICDGFANRLFAACDQSNEADVSADGKFAKCVVVGEEYDNAKDFLEADIWRRGAARTKFTVSTGSTDECFNGSSRRFPAAAALFVLALFVSGA